jgi:hypothetical protein
LGLENKVIAISGDNTNTNFGGLKRRGTNNVFCKIKEDLNRDVICLGCVAHMIHNYAHSSINTIPLDTEDLVVKFFGYFHIYIQNRVEWLKEFCDFVGQQYTDILGYSNVRWLSLLPAVRRCELYPALQSFFMSEEKCPVMLKKWFLIHAPSFG